MNADRFKYKKITDIVLTTFQKMGRTIIIKEKISVMISVNRRLNSCLIYFKKPCKGQSGSALLGLIVTMVFLSALAAAMIAQTTTGSLGFVNANSSLRAYYLAESGFRYAAAKLKHKASLDDLHDQGPFSLGNKGSFTLEFATYIFEVTGGIGTNELITRVSFGKAPLLTGTGSGYVKVGNNPVQPFDAVTVDAFPNDDVVRFTSAQPWNVFVGEDVKLVVKSKNASVSEGGDLNLQEGSSDAFPQYNGRFKTQGKTYSYKQRGNDELVGIYCVSDGGCSWPLSLTDGEEIVLQDFTILHSIGTYGETSRKIVYNIPLSTSEKSEFHDTFETKDNWEEVSTLGTHEIQTIGGDSFLKVTGTTPIGSDEGSLIKIKSSKVDAILERAHASAGNFLSYDTQVKVGFDPSVPSTYMAGISFRQDAVATDNSYGVSFLKAGSSDKIPADLVPYNDCPMIVLWQQTNSGDDKKWLAYKHLIGHPIFLFDNNDGEVEGTFSISTDPPWALTDLDSYSDTFCWTDSPGESVDYGNNVNTELTYEVDISSNQAILEFWHRGITEDVHDTASVLIDYHHHHWWVGWLSNISGEYPKTLATYTGDFNTWRLERIDISGGALSNSDKIRIIFRLKSNGLVTDDGWYVDDVMVAKDFPINEATLMVRVKEAATLYFTGGGATPIEAGDIVRQATNWGTVLGTPILESGSWTVGGNATGIILLNKISGSFTAGQPLYVNGTSLATTASGTGFYRARDNYIRVYYGDISGYGTPDGQWLDYNKHGNPRGELHWPPDELEEWSGSGVNDYFTLVQWDKVEDVAVSSLDKISSLDEPDAILRTNELTTTTGTFTDTEIGLHTFGNNSTSVYFDDFGLQTDVPTSEGFLPAVQQ